METYEVVNVEAVARELQTARDAEVDAEQKLAWAQIALEQTPEWQEAQRLKAWLAEQRNAVAVAESKLREAALAAYRITGDKNPVPGVSIVLFDKLDYIQDMGLQRLKQHAAMLVEEALDVKGIEKVPVAPVEVSKEPRVFIADDLNLVLT